MISREKESSYKDDDVVSARKKEVEQSNFAQCLTRFQTNGNELEITISIMCYSFNGP